MIRQRPFVTLVAASLVGALTGACSSDEAASASPSSSPDGGVAIGADGGPIVDQDGGTTTNPDGSTTTNPDGGNPGRDGGPTGSSPVIGGCAILPSNHIFNTPIDNLPVHPNSAAFMSTIGTTNLHLDLGSTTNQQSATFYGIPYNIVHGNTLTWGKARYFSADPEVAWNAQIEADCATSAKAIVSPCTNAANPNPYFPFPASPIVEGGIDTNASQPYGDHHILMLDVDNCRLWETYHSYPTPGVAGSWDIYGSATFDLSSNALRPAGWTSADAAGFPILPLLLRADEATSGTIKHALRFTIDTHHIRIAYTWPARHLTDNGTSSANQPPMGQLIRLKASYAIPANFNTQAKAILQAMKTYGMYLADGGSDMYVSGEPSANWQSATISQVQSVSSSQFEAVDLAPIMARPGFNANSGAVPP